MADIDFHHPLFLHLSDTPGTILISHRLTVSPDLSAGLVFTSDSAAVWTDLKDRFSKVDVKGHKKESCYHLIGFPPDFKFNRKKTSSAALAVSSDDSLLNSQSAPVFTPQQYSELLELLNKSRTVVAPAVNCAGSLQWQDEGDW
ncbi:hypothetical protein GOBAR_AA00700 [Gossypium barbadense]|uniref:Uncharacterized protein n=1 Tax=Gossypium barbadense TaxID=3634 RepID=A0A2P5YWA2_GOSBA|nr:hypothetical protein GOBAR_AA00700 [Gossypium barbadense]